MSYENKILQMKKLLQKSKAQSVERPVFQKPECPPYTTAWEQIGLELVENDFGVLFRRVVKYNLDYVHGVLPLGSFFEATQLWEDATFEHPFAVRMDEGVLFFDTETTGLKGVGTQIFLLGFIEPSEDEFVLTQYVLADPANEAAFLFESKLWQKNTTIISYNGKSFDWPQLETRWTLNQQWLPKLNKQRQIDLLHSSKRIWKDDLVRMKLKQVEEEKLGFTREEDIPGFLAPIIYLDAVKSGCPDALMKVLKHNEWDLLSLITLYSHSTMLLFDQHIGETAVTLTNIGKWFADLKEAPQSKIILEKVTANYHLHEAKDAHFYLAKHKKREKSYGEAVTYYLTAIEFVNERKKLQIYEDLAIIYEHYYKEYSHALKYTELAMDLIKKSASWNAEQQARKLQNFEKRMYRLEIKNNFPGKRKF